MNLQEIEQRIADIDVDQGFELIYGMLRAYGFPKGTISRLENGSFNKSDREGELLWKGKVYFRFAGKDEGDLHALIDDARNEDRIVSQRPRFLIVTDSKKLLAVDTGTEQTLDIATKDLKDHAAFFLPWAGIEKTQLESVNLADIKAAEKMAKLYDEITKHNAIESEAEVHDLNVFFSRLLFCFFAEDTDVFERDSFTNAINTLTASSGEDLAAFFDQLFEVLNTDLPDREGVPSHFRVFGYVNGNLFARKAHAPRFTAKARSALLECATLNWSQINPDIFGSMIQAVVHPGKREGLGMHYTSVENIMKVIRPLFLDDLLEAFDAAADKPKKLKELLDRIYAIQIFDPACGSGNFLIIAYKELRKLEHQIMQRLAELDPKRGAGLFEMSGVRLENFYGIEIDDFAHEIAILSLWLAKHQMNVEFKELFGAEIPLIPLKDSGNVACGNAARLDWLEVVPDRGMTFLLSNPPYQGGTRQSDMQKRDLAAAFDDASINKYLDYVSIWLFKGAQFVAKREAELGFVTTNSVSQGNHVALLWPRLLAEGAQVSFAHSAFRWANQAKANAGVTCVIIGLFRTGTRRRRRYFSDGTMREASYINSYLVPNGSEVIVEQVRHSISGLPPMVFGSMPRDGGHLVLGQADLESLLRETPAAAEFVRRYTGAEEFINGKVRYCLWITDDRAEIALGIPAIATRLSLVAATRAASSASSTRRYASEPHRFVQRAHRDSPAIIVPSVSSERRDYIPMGFLDASTVISNLANAIYDAEPWVFGLIQSRMHMVWVRAVAGRLESRLRYSAVLVYNTFPVPELTETNKARLAERAFGVLGAREQFPDKTLAELYDPDKMPGGLRKAHEQLDESVDRLYRKKPFESDEERLELLFQMYEAKTTGAELTLDA